MDTGQPSRPSTGVARSVSQLVAAGLLAYMAAVLRLVGLFACGDLASPIPYCTGSTSISGGWGYADVSPLWAPALLGVAGLVLGIALWLVSSTIGRRRPVRWFIAAGELIVLGTAVVALP